jgi:two-component system, OmpR family, sensor kinase
MRRLPIRARLTLVFALAMAVVLAAVGALLYVRLGASLDEQLDERLEARAGLLAQLVRGGGPPRALEGGEEEFAQVVGPDGAVLAATPGLADAPLLSEGELARARERRLVIEKELASGADEAEESRLLVSSVDDGTLILVGGSLEDRDEALAGLLAQLLVLGPVALVLASGAGYLLAGAALRPVAAMRRRAGEISADTSGRRLPLPDAHDEVFRLGETLNEMLARLEEGLRRERRFVADAGHELRTPLALLRTELELARRRPRSQEELEHALDSAAEEVDRLTRLAEDMLVLASTEEGRVRLRESDVSVRELLEGVALRFGARAAAAGRALVLSTPSQTTLRGDRLRLEQALGNLVDNALRHGDGPIRLEAAPRNGSLELSVSDEGAGFPPTFIAGAFERFSRADEARTRGGAGLGLAIVDAVARAHGGSVRAGNETGGGAVVTIVLPPLKGNDVFSPPPRGAQRTIQRR